jgi:predicted nuclease of predicted toxin-antitoxin system
MSLSIVIDMNLSPDWVALLQAHGWSAVHWSTVGDPRATDRAIMD